MNSDYHTEEAYYDSYGHTEDIYSHIYSTGSMDLWTNLHFTTNDPELIDYPSTAPKKDIIETIWFFLTLVLYVVGIIGNSLIMTALCTRLRAIPNAFIFSMATSDLTLMLFLLVERCMIEYFYHLQSFQYLRCIAMNFISVSFI
jgi:hypothetical protein